MNRENIYSLKGFSKVYSFTVKQTFKNKAYLASIFVFMVVFILMGPLNYFMTKSSMESAEKAINTDLEKVEIDNVYISNETGFNLDDIKIGNAKVTFSEPDAQNTLGRKDVSIYIKREETGYKVNGILADDSDISIHDMSAITDNVKEYFDEARMKSLSVSDKDIQKIAKGISHDSVITQEEYIQEENKTVTGDKFSKYILGFSILIFMMVSMSNSYIISSVTEEKQSKLVESLLVSVRPMALLLGKIIGMMTYIAVVLCVGLISSKISDFIMENVMHVDMKATASTGFDLSIFKGMGTLPIIFCIFTMLIGFLSFAILSGLFGSACTKIEDIQNATGNIMTISMMGYFVSFGAGMMDEPVVNHLLSLIPPFSYYTLPVMYAAGRIELPIVLLSYAIQILLLFLLVILSAKTYRNLLLSDSSTPKLKAIFKSAKA